jgi:hypothetical protein
MRHRAALGLLALGVGFVVLGSQALAAGTVSPLPPSDYTVSSACAAPEPHEAGCLALQLVPQTAEARAHTHPLGVTRAASPQSPSPAAGFFGLRPQDLHAAYELPSSAPSSQTIAIVDAYNDPSAAEDLGAYDKEFPALPECTTGNGCFKQVNQSGETSNLPFPKTQSELEAARTSGIPARKKEAQRAEGWALEISLDIEVAHATCESCSIVLVEANSASDENLRAAEQTAVAQHATEISNSWGGPEIEAAPFASSFDHQGIVITASAGDYGYLNWNSPVEAERGFAEFPASSPDVVAVGGTRLTLGAGSSWQQETVWNGHGAGGGGCSVEFTAQPWQQSLADWSSVGCGEKRAVADVSADADPYTGVAVYDSAAKCEYVDEKGKVRFGPWCTLGGTSLASPLIAATFALAGGAQGVPYPARTLYGNAIKSPASLHDVNEGSNGACAELFNEETGVSGCSSAEEAKSCETRLICLAGTGYDGPTGVGTPHGIAAFKAPEGAASEQSGVAGSGSSPPAGTPSATPSSSAAAPIQLSRLALTLHAILALNHRRPKASQVGFSFTVSAAVRLRGVLSKRVSVHGHVRWLALRDSISIAAASGRNSRRLNGHNVLTPGYYRLTLSPTQGSARSIVFQIG